LLATLLPVLTLASEAAADAQSWSGDYSFEPGSGVECPVALEREDGGLRFTWPASALPRWDTALLEVTSLDAGDEPRVHFRIGTEGIEASAAPDRLQSLDPKARGARWLNVSSLRSKLRPGAVVRIETQALTLAEGSARLRLFDNRLDLAGTLLVIAAHPDDAEIAAFGLYADRRAFIVTLTSGNAGDMNYAANVSDPAAHYRLKGYLRAVDSVTVPWLGGVPPARTFNLGYFDSLLEAMERSPDVPLAEAYSPNTDVAVYRRANIGDLLPKGPRTNTWNHLVDDLVTILRKTRPTLIVTPDPRLDGHPDHEYATVALVEAMRRWHGEALFLLYTNHAVEDRYPFGAAGTVVSLPPRPAGTVSLASVYSHPTDPQLQLRKLFALEAMHDLRPAPAEQAPGAAERVTRPDYPRIPEVDYFRRGPRANELFYIYRRDQLLQLGQSFLEARPCLSLDSQ
jgi:LmbE family N-acetylglucosaminyl deacetylase